MYFNRRSMKKQSQSTTINPETCQDQIDNDLLNSTIMRAKSKLRDPFSSTKINRKCSISSLSMSNQSWSTIRPHTTIHKLVKQRHEYEQKTMQLTNHWGYLSQRFSEQKKKCKRISAKKSKMLDLAEESKSLKSFMDKAILKEKKITMKRKLNIKSTVLNHRETKGLSLEKSRMEKAKAGEIGRKQQESYHKEIEEIKAAWQSQNKSAANREKSLELERAKQKQQRQEQLQIQAQINFKKKWLSEYLKKERAERQNKIRNRLFAKKLNELLQKTEAENIKLHH